MAGRRFPRSSEWPALAVVLLAASAWVAPAHAATTVRDAVAGLSVALPEGWVGPLPARARAARTVDRLLVATDTIPDAAPTSACKAARQLQRGLSQDGALVWVRERVLPSRRELGRLPRAPRSVRLDAPESTGCFRSAYRWRFRTGGRAITVAAFVGARAGETTRRDVESLIAGLGVEPVRMGASREGRAIELHAAGDPAARTRLLVVGCIHGDECASDSVLDRLAARPARAVDLWLVPTLNPDGRRANTRQNAAGVDLNRNFPGTWRAGSRRGDRYYAGPRAASEPETRVAMRAIRRLRPDVTIWFHQPETNVRAGGGSARAARAYAGLVGLPYLPLPVPPGAATAWQTKTFAGSQAFVVELAPGRLDAAEAARHVRAVRQLARRLDTKAAG